MWFEELATHLANHLLQRSTRATQAGLVLGSHAEGGAQVAFPDSIRTQHAVVVGGTGSGKTHLLELLALRIAERFEGFAFFDFHGDVAQTLTARLLQLPEADRRLVLVDPSDPLRSPAINLLEAGGAEAHRFRKVSELSAVLRQRWGVDSFGARTEELLRNSLYTLAAAGLSVGDLSRLLTNAIFRRAAVATVTHPEVATYWTERYEPLSDAMKAVFREPLLNRITAFLVDPSARHLLGQRTSTIDFDKAIEQQQWLVLRLPKGSLREHAHTLGNLLFTQLQFAALARERVPANRRHTFTIICDEAQNLAENDSGLNTLLTEGRKFGVSVISANQYWEQLPRELRGALLSASTHIFFRTSSADAHTLSSELSAEQRQRLAVELTKLPRGHALVRFGHHRPLRLRVAGMPPVPAIDHERLATLVEPITRLRADIERELVSREPGQVSIPTSTHATPTPEGQHEW